MERSRIKAHYKIPVNDSQLNSLASLKDAKDLYNHLTAMPPASVSKNQRFKEYDRGLLPKDLP